MDLVSPANVLVTLVISLGVVMTLYATSAFLLRAIHVHNLTVEAHVLRNQYACRLQALRRGVVANIELVSPGLNQPLAGVDFIGAAEEPVITAKAA